MKGPGAASLALLLVAVASQAAIAAPPAPPAESGQRTTLAAGDDGDLRRGVKWPIPRFTDHGDGTVSDRLTGLTWLKDASCEALSGAGFADGLARWFEALAAVATLGSGTCGLADGSAPGDWYLPTVLELSSLVHFGHGSDQISGPLAIPDTRGDGPWGEGDPFSGIVRQRYWTSTPISGAADSTSVWYVATNNGRVGLWFSTGLSYVWPLRRDGVALDLDGGLRYPDGRTQASAAGLFAPPAATMQTVCRDSAGSPLASCDGSGQDGESRAGIPWPQPRFVDIGDGTVTDRLTGLVWLRDASCDALSGAGETNGRATWAEALMLADGLGSGTCGLTDGSAPGDWEVPNVRQLASLIHWGHADPALPDTQGTGQWSAGDPFTGVEPDAAWTSSTDAGAFPDSAWLVRFEFLGITGGVGSSLKSAAARVWPVRTRP